MRRFVNPARAHALLQQTTELRNTRRVLLRDKAQFLIDVCGRIHMRSRVKTRQHATQDLGHRPGPRPRSRCVQGLYGVRRIGDRDPVSMPEDGPALEQDPFPTVRWIHGRLRLLDRIVDARTTNVGWRTISLGRLGGCSRIFSASLAARIPISALC
jgi:hypothetical protein